jgi:hypothetical protein
MYRQGDVRGDIYANAMPIMEMIEDDLSAVSGGESGRLLLRTDVFTGRRGDGFLLRLVRTIPGGEQNHPILRRAGGTASASEVYTGSDPGMAERKSLAPPSGLMEVAYALIQEETDPQGLFALYRGERAPINEPGGFFDPQLEDSWDEARVRQQLKPVAADILGLWLLCLSQTSEDWDEASALNHAADAGASSMVNWDSTRGILPPSQFPLALGEASLTDYRDDVFPRRVRLLLEVARGNRPDARLRSTMHSEQTRIEVNTTRGFPEAGDEPAFLKVGHEWLEIEPGSAGTSSARVARNQRRTASVTLDHPTGTPVYLSRSFRLTMPLPSARSHFGDLGR